MVKTLLNWINYPKNLIESDNRKGAGGIQLKFHFKYLKRLKKNLEAFFANYGENSGLNNYAKNVQYRVTSIQNGLWMLDTTSS